MLCDNSIKYIIISKNKKYQNFKINVSIHVIFLFHFLHAYKNDLIIIMKVFLLFSK